MPGDPSGDNHRYVLQLPGDETFGEEDLKGLDLRSAKLVVLSACETQVGKRLAGDELMSLARSFLASGASSVIATLWKVDDFSASQIIGRFFSYLKAGFHPAEALHRAQAEFREEQRLLQGRDTYEWAPFVLIGTAGPAA